MNYSTVRYHCRLVMSVLSVSKKSFEKITSDILFGSYNDLLSV